MLLSMSFNALHMLTSIAVITHEYLFWCRLLVPASLSRHWWKVETYAQLAREALAANRFGPTNAELAR